MSELKPCPFCGSDSVTWQSLGDHTRTGCVDCGAEVTRPMGLYRNAMIEWNTRPIEDALRVQLAERDALIERLVWVGDGMTFKLRGQTVQVDKWDKLTTEWQAMKGGER